MQCCHWSLICTGNCLGSDPALYGSPSKDAADQVKSGNNAALAYPNFFPGQGGLPIKVDGQTIGHLGSARRAPVTGDDDSAILPALQQGFARVQAKTALSRAGVAGITFADENRSHAGLEELFLFGNKLR